MSAEICYIVNEVGQTSVPVDIAAALKRHEDTDIDVLSWFRDDLSYRTDEVTYVGLDQTRHVSLRGIRNLRTHLSEYDLIQIHHHVSGFIIRGLFGHTDIPIVSRVGNIRRGHSFLARNINSLTHPLCDAVVCNSQSVYDSVSEVEKLLVGRDTYRIIPNGFDEHRVSKSLSRDAARISKYQSDDEVLISTASRMIEAKAHDILLRALAIVDRRGDRPVRLVLAGDGPRRDDLESLASRLDITDIVEFPGFLERHEVHHLMDHTDVYTMPSRSEGFSNASLEAMGIGTACIFSKIGPFRQPFEDHALFHRLDDWEDLADKLLRFVADPSLREEYATQARTHVRENYPISKTARLFRGLYDELLYAGSH
jgi:glycosyltransferase involved in cell wall biosynthesis